MTEQVNEALRGPQSGFPAPHGQTITNQSKNPYIGDLERPYDAALAYSDIGLPVFTLNPNSKITIKGTHGALDGTTDKVAIQKMFNDYPGANLAISTGSGLVVIDLDKGHSDGVDGIENFRAWQEKNGYFPDTWTACTPTGGQHLYFKTSLDVHNFQENAAEPLPTELKGIDLRGIGGYVVAAPSTINGKKYFWDVAPDETPLAADDELLTKLLQDLTPKKETKETQTNEPLKIEKGSRNGTLTSYAGKLQREGLPDTVIELALLSLNNDYCRPPLKEREVKNIVKSVTRYEKGQFQTEETPAQAFKPFSLGSYITGGQFSADINYFKKYKDRKTGFSNIDENLTLYPGLAALGGQSSLGKTSFCVNLADNLVKSGETVLYFSLEQEPIEIATKSLSRRLAEVDPDSPLKNVDIKNGATSETLERVKQEYAADIADRFIIVRCDFTITADAIRDYVEQYIKDTGRKPVVFIDYLQLISPPDDFKGDTRAAIDHNIKLLKTMQVKNELLVILVSSFNRSSYETPASFDDFKESGLVEFTCDYVWALQLSILATNEFYRAPTKNGSRETAKKEKSDMIYQANNERPKHIEFVSLKSRNGRQSYNAFFKYYMDQDYFVPEDSRAYIDDVSTNDFYEVPDDYEIPWDDIKVE